MAAKGRFAGMRDMIAGTPGSPPVGKKPVPTEVVGKARPAGDKVGVPAKQKAVARGKRVA